MNIKDLPDKENGRLSECWTLAITPQMKRDIQEFETIHNKNMRKFIRGLIQEALDALKRDKAG
jgi:hypothetical protein